MYIKRPTSIPVYVVGTALNESELTSTSSTESSVTGASENCQLPANKVPNTSDTPQDCEELIEKAFNDVSIVHSKYTCSQKNCVNLSSQELKRIKCRGTGKDCFNHQWLLDPALSYCEKTGYFWLLYEEGVGMFCLLCKKHNKINLQNKSSKFNIEASVRFKRNAVLEHGNSQQHKSAVEAEMIRRVSVFHKEIERRDQSRDDVIHSAFLALYWLAKEEVANKKFAALLEMTELLGLSDMKFFNHRSAGGTREMLLILGQVIKNVTLEKVKRASCFALLCDEVCDIANNEQLVTFIKYVDPDSSKATTQFLSTKNLLTNSESANAETIKSTVLTQMAESKLEVSKLTGLATDGASVMTGKRNGVASKLREESKLLLSVHCICHRLALACNDANDDVAYIKTVEKILIQLWSLFHNSAKKTATYAKAVVNYNQISLSTQGRKKIGKSFKKACRTRWLSMEKAIDGVYNDFVPLTQTLRLLSEDGDSMATGLLQQVGNIKFLSAVYLLHQVLPPLAHLSKVFQAGSVSFSAIGPAINYTLEALKTVSEQKRPLSALQKDLCTDGRLSVCDLSSPSAHQEQKLTNLTDRYVKALQENINNRFDESLPVLTAFRIFDVTAIPNRSDVGFKEYGVKDVQILAEHFFQGEPEEKKNEKKEELLSEWQKLKYNFLQMREDIPPEIAKPTNNMMTKSPTEWLLERMLSMRSTYQHFFPEMLRIAEVCLSLPVSNAWPERGASAIKRIKTRMRSRIKDDMLEALMQISINGPKVKELECTGVVKESVQQWLKEKPRRKLAKKTATGNRNTSTVSTSDAAVQVEISETEDEEPENIDDSEVVQIEEEDQLQLEVNAAIAVMKLPDGGDSDSDSAFESDNDYD